MPGIDVSVKQLTSTVYEVALGAVNVWLLISDDGLVLIDTGMAGHAETILQAARDLNQGTIRHILLTHAHPDHIGGLAAIQRATGAQAYAHPLDAPIVRRGGDFDPRQPAERQFQPAPGLLIGILFRLFMRPYLGIEAAQVQHEISEGDVLPFLPGSQVIFTPGHSLGHLAYLWRSQILFAGDMCANLLFLDWSLGYENFEEGQRSLKKLCQYDFDIVTFGHGRAITRNASPRWRNRWGK